MFKWLYEAVKINDTILIQCGCHGSFLGHIELNIVKKQIIDYVYKLITINESIKPDEEVENIVDHIMQPYQDLKNKVLGKTNIILHRYNTIASSMDDLLLSVIKSITNADVAFSNGWRYGVPIPIGTITKWDLFNIIPVNPEISTVELTGEEIIKMLEENIERTFSAEPIKQMGGYIKRCLGISVKMRIENPNKHRIQQIFIGDESLIKDKIYKTAFVTTQGVPEKLGKNRQNLSVKAVDAMEAYLVKNPDYTAEICNTFSLV
jgi:S-sulfosulfanyl-L-cysteine sulfohydrolase